MIDPIERQDAIDAVESGCQEWKGIFQRCEANIKELPPAQSKQHGRIFQEIVVEYPSYNIYPEYIGKPYFSIKYTENEQEFIGYGTYKPEVLSEYLKEYFMPSTQSERETATWIIDSGYPQHCWCSNCNHRFDLFDPKLIHFCPNCGREMKTCVWKSLDEREKE